MNNLVLRFVPTGLLAVVEPARCRWSCLQKTLRRSLLAEVTGVLWLRTLAFALGFAFAGANPSQCAPRNNHLNFERFTPHDGLPAAVVYCGLQDSRGFLWFGTADGVARFDGREFRVFVPDPTDPSSLSNGAVLGIQEDTNGDLWLATEKGLDLWHRDTERFSHFLHDPTNPASLADDVTQCILRDADGTLWIGTRSAGLDHFDPVTGKFEHWGPGRAGGVTAPWIRCLLRDRAGVLWAGSGGGGLYRLDPGSRTFRVYANDPADLHSLTDNDVSALVEDPSGNLWIGTERGLCRLDPSRGILERIPLDPEGTAGLPSQTVTALSADKDGVIWIGTDGSGFIRYNPRTRHFVYHRRVKSVNSTLISDEVRALLEDSKGDLWIGHFPAGISHADRASGAFQVFTCVPGDPDAMSDDQVLAFLDDSNGDLWVGTDNGGVTRWSASTRRWTSYTYSATNPEGISGKAAVCLLRDHNGALWVGTWDGGLNRLRPETGTFAHFRTRPDDPTSLSDNHAWQMVEDHQGRLWIATIGGGINRYVSDKQGFEHVEHQPGNPHSLNDNIVSALYVSRDGALWAGTPRGLGRLAPGSHDWQRFNSRPGEGSLDGYWIFDILEDRDGTIWATTEGGGLNHLDPRTGRIESFRVADGLPSDVLRGILQDDTGALWIGSNEGLVRFDPVTRKVRIFDESNGLPGTQFNPHARLRLATGEFLFGSTQGFVRFDPRALLIDDVPPPVVLTDLEIFSRVVRPGTSDGLLKRSITETRRLEIPARFSVISFEFAALNFRSTAHTRYLVKLVGFDSGWRDPAPERRVTYTNLDPGQYTLRIRAANGDGVWNSAGATLDLVIIPPWWKTWWFRSGAALLVLGFASTLGWSVSTHRLREEARRRELARERERTAERERAAEALRVLNQELENRVEERTEQLTKAVKELEAFSYSVSHDLRAPLRSMHGFSRVLLEDYAEKLDVEGRDCLNRICKASERMGQLIDDMLSLSKVSRCELHIGQVDLSALACLVTEELQLANKEQRIEFVIEPNLTAFGDGRLLRIAFENLLGNACKFSSKVPVARIEFGATQHEGKRMFFIRDNGAGFDSRSAQKLFGAFQRFHSASEFPGTGIGLATVQRIIHRHGGDITVDSAPGHGATFYFSLPDQPVDTP